MGRRPTRSARGGLARGGQKGGFKEALEAEVVAEIEALVGTGAVEDWDFEAIETATRRKAMRVAARAVEQRFKADTSDHIGPTAPCSCGQVARYAGRHAKTFQSALGELRLERAYYHCEACEAGFCPRDRTLGIEGSSLSPTVTRMVGRVGAMVSFAQGSELMQELAGVPLDPSSGIAVEDQVSEGPFHCHLRAEPHRLQAALEGRIAHPRGDHDLGVSTTKVST